MKKIFSLFGTIALDGMEDINKQLNSFDKKMKEMSKQLTKTGRQFSKIGKDLSKNITAPVLGAATAIGALTIKTGQYADKLLDLNQITGLSTDTLQEFENVSRVAGVNFDGLVQAASKFTGRIPQLIKGTSESAMAFQSLGVQLKDNGGNVRSMDELFPEIIKKLQGMENVTERNAIAQQLFGKSMNDLAPVIGMTTEQFEMARQEAHDLNLVLSEESLNAANDFRIEIDKLRGQFEGLMRSIAIDFLPIVRDDFIPFVKNVIVPAIQEYADKIKGVINWFMDLDDSTKNSILRMVGLAAAVGPLLLILGKAILIIGNLRKTVLLLNAAFLTNPIGQIVLALTALIAVSVGVYNAYKNMNKVMDENRKKIREDLQAREDQTKINALETLIDLYGRLANMDKEVISTEEFRNTSREIEHLEKRIGALGMEFTGSFGNRLEGAKKKLAELRGEIVDTGEDVTDTMEEIAIQGDSAEEIEEQQLEAKLERLQEEYDAEEETLRKTIEAKKKEEEIAQEVEDQLSQMAKERKDEEDRLWEEYLNKKKKDKDNELAIEKAHQEQVKQLRVDAVNATFDIFSSFNQNEEITLDNKYKRDKERIENSIMDEEKKAKALENLDKTYQKKKDEMRRKQAIMDKAQALFNIALNTAESITKVLWNPIMVGVVAALGAAQAAAVALKPIPLQKGGLVQGSMGGVFSMVGENNKDELVLPLEEGVSKLANMLIEKLGSMAFPNTSSPAAAIASSGGSTGHNLTLNIGNFYGDESGIKELTRRIIPLLNSENERKGIS